MRVTDSAVAFRWLATEIDKRVGPNEKRALLSVSTKVGVVPRSEISDAEPRADDLSNYKTCERDDIVINRMSAYQGALGIARQQGIVSPDYAVLRTNFRADARYLTYVMRSIWFVSQMTQRLRGIGSPGATSVRTPRINIEDLGDISVQLPPTQEQRRIADFLDDQVARIDNIIDLRTDQRVLLNTVEEGELEHLLWARAKGTELRRLGTTVTTGPFGTAFAAADYVSGGVPMLNPTHIASGRIVPDERHSVAPATAARLARHRLRSGDVITGRKGDIGRSAVVGPAEDGWICGSDSIAIHPDADQLAPDFLDMVLHLPRIRADLASRSPGATMPTLNEGMILSLEVPAVNLEEQRKLAERGRTIRQQVSAGRDSLASSIALLQELKRSLITAAVTGEFEVSSADGSRVPA